VLARVEAGATLLVTGFIEADEYGRYAPRLHLFNLETRPVPVAHYEGFEQIVDEDGDYRQIAVFGGDRMQRIEKAAAGKTVYSRCRVLSCGQGNIYYCPLPIELNDDYWKVRDVYNDACRLLGWEGASAQGLLIRRLDFLKDVLYLGVNEASFMIASGIGGWEENLPDSALGGEAEQSAIAFLSRTTGEAPGEEPGRAERKEKEENAKETKPPLSN
jgi:hypothetical protein